MVDVLLPNPAIFQDVNALIHITKSVQSWLKERHQKGSMARPIARTEDNWTVIGSFRAEIEKQISISNIRYFGTKMGQHSIGNYSDNL